jgi:methyltransferase (TIGR00027 family)
MLVTRRRLDHSASVTAQFCAAVRAAESMQPSACRLLDDPYSRYFAGRCATALIHPASARAALLLLDRYMAGLHPHIALRQRYADQVRHDAVTSGIDQVVILGAGFDTTIVRTRSHTPATLFEVDAPTTQRAKRRIIDRAKLPVFHKTRWVPCDFEHDCLSDRLREAGFDSSRAAVVIWLGVSFYLTWRTFTRTLVDLTTVFVPNSVLVMDYGDPQLGTGDHDLAGARRVTSFVRRKGEPYKIGFTDPQLTAVLNSHGFTAQECVRVPDLISRYADGKSLYRTDDWLGTVTAERV